MRPRTHCSASACFLGLLLLLPRITTAESLGPEIAIIIDDLGNRRNEGEQAIALPGPINYGVLPHTPFAKHLANMAVNGDHEVIIHMPMQPVGASNPGPGALDVSMARDTVARARKRAMSAIPQARGLSNHMGSRATAHEALMASVMQTLSRLAPSEFFYVDSRTVATSVSRRLARAHRIPHLTRDVFLDNVRERRAIQIQLEKLIAVAERRGYAIGIGHPYLETLEVLELELPRLMTAGITFVKLSRLAARVGQSPQLAQGASVPFSAHK